MRSNKPQPQPPQPIGFGLNRRNQIMINYLRVAVLAGLFAIAGTALPLVAAHADRCAGSCWYGY